MCEYAHAMRNGPGSVKDYTDLMYKYPNFIGGCIWEWADHTVIVDGVPKYGGDFKGELTNDGNFCCDGLVFYDRSFKAGSLEVKACYQGLNTEFESGMLKFINRYDFTNLNEYKIKLSVRKKWQWSREGGMNFDRIFEKVYSIKNDNGRITVKGNIAPVSRGVVLNTEQIFEVYENGDIKVTLKAENLQDVVSFLRLSYEFKTPYEKQTFSYFGMGEYENYIDLNHHVKMGYYESNADNEYVNYIRPQEHGNHTNAK